MIDKGYGVLIANNNALVENACEKIVDLILTGDETDLKESYLYFCKADELDPDSREAKEDFAAEYSSWMSFNEGGPIGLLADIINKRECQNDCAFCWLDDYLYVSARVPLDEESKAFMLTQEDIRRILAEYLNPVLKADGIELGWVYVNI